ncbi:MAG: M1 family aminopeptidase [Candidatus Eisenbacteria bacterium]
MRRLAAVLAVALLLFALGAVIAAELTDLRPKDRVVAGDTPGEVTRLPARLIERHGPGKALRTEPTACPDSFDVVHYRLEIDADHAGGTLAGDAIVTVASHKEGLGSIRLDLKSLAVTGVFLGAVPLAYTHDGDTLLVIFDTPLTATDTAVVRIVYGGTPWNEGGGGFGGFWIYGAPPITDFSMGVGLYTDPPSMGRTWFPGVDQPCDKATCDIIITTPLAKVGVASGALDSVVVDSVAGTNTWYWREDHPIATYLMAVSIAKYDAIPDSADPRIVYYVHRTQSHLTHGTFRNVDLMMDAFEEIFGPYPYPGDKFSFVTTPIGDMEHQTCVFHSNSLMTGDTLYDDILSHELSHQWFGDCVTYGDWRDVWLSEGFATYSEAVWREWRYGEAGYHAYVTNSLMRPYLQNADNLTYPIYDPDFLWGTISYEKGGTVLHMLRHVVGDSLFFACLNAYLDDHEYGDATTPDFVASCERVYGGDLDWYFDEWIYQGGHPVFDWGWSAEETAPGVHRVTIDTRQVQTVGPIYTMPVDFRIETGGGDTIVVGWVDAETNRFTFDVGSAPTAVVLDPEDWLLDEANEVSTSVAGSVPPLRLAVGAPRPNPFNPSTTIPFSLPEREHVALRVYSLDGHVVRTLVDGERAAGESTRCAGTERTTGRNPSRAASTSAGSRPANRADRESCTWSVSVVLSCGS